MAARADCSHMLHTHSPRSPLQSAMQPLRTILHVLQAHCTHHGGARAHDIESTQAEALMRVVAAAAVMQTRTGCGQTLTTPLSTEAMRLRLLLGLR